MTQGKPKRYRSYLLRLWQDSPSRGVLWRFSLEDPHTGGREGFADIEQMLAFLRAVMQTAESKEEE